MPQSLARRLLKPALVFTAATAAFRAVIRLAVSEWTAQMTWNYIWIALMLVAFIALAVIGRKTSERVQPVERFRFPQAITYLFGGFLMGFSSLLDAFLWYRERIVPAPSAVVMSKMDQIVMLLQMIFGVLAGVYLVMRGADRLSGRSRNGFGFRLASLLPLLWAAMLLVRYEMSYISAIDIGQSFYDVALLVLTVLYLFMSAKYAALSAPFSKSFFAVSLFTAVFSLSAAVLRVVLWFAGEKVTSYHAGDVFTLPLLGVGLMAAVSTVVFACAPVQQETEEADGQQ